MTQCLNGLAELRENHVNSDNIYDSMYPWTSKTRGEPRK